MPACVRAQGVLYLLLACAIGLTVWAMLALDQKLIQVGALHCTALRRPPAAAKATQEVLLLGA